MKTDHSYSPRLKREDWRLLSVFHGYRLLLAFTFTISVSLLADTGFFRSVDTQQFLAASLFYLFASGIVLLAVIAKKPDFEFQLSFQVLLDVVMINVLAYASGGIRSGLALMLLATIACAGLISRGRLVLFHASLAVIGVLATHAYGVLYNKAPIQDFFQVGMMSLGYFAMAWLAYVLARYAEASERLAIERGVDLANMAQINQLVIRDLHDGVLVVDEHQRIRACNPQAEHLFGSIPRDAAPLLVEYSPDLNEWQERWSVRPESALPPLRAPFDNREINVRFVSIGKKQSAAAAIVIFLIDLSEQQQQVQQVKLAALGRLTASIAHEIRNPLSSINHATELLQEDDSQSIGNRRLLAIIRDNALRLDRMVQEVLHLNRRDHAHLEAIPTRPYLESFIEEFSQTEKVPEGVFSLELDTDRPLLFDRVHLHQVLWNLTRNAWRHCHKRTGSLRICLSPAAMEDMLQLDVVDDGPGVEPEHQDQLFEPFFTTDSKGTGLGLYIARQVCQANGAYLDYVAVSPGGQFRILVKTVS
ncbi:MAG TPA: ATP-binding protein [Burkholderiales bacterium]|nr:ATP-binding protein [Burkholderiales bacterium]